MIAEAFPESDIAALLEGGYDPATLQNLYLCHERTVQLLKKFVLESPFGLIHLIYCEDSLSLENLHPDELSFAQQLKSKSRNEEFLKSRSLLRKTYFSEKTPLF